MAGVALLLGGCMSDLPQSAAQEAAAEAAPKQDSAIRADEDRRIAAARGVAAAADAELDRQLRSVGAADRATTNRN